MIGAKRMRRLYELRRAAAEHLKALLPLTVAEAAEETGLSVTTIQKIGHEFRIEFTPCEGKGRKWKLKPEWEESKVNDVLRRKWS